MQSVFHLDHSENEEKDSYELVLEASRVQSQTTVLSALWSPGLSFHDLMSNASPSAAAAHQTIGAASQKFEAAALVAGSKSGRINVWSWTSARTNQSSSTSVTASSSSTHSSSSSNSSSTNTSAVSSSNSSSSSSLTVNSASSAVTAAAAASSSASSTSLAPDVAFDAHKGNVYALTFAESRLLLSGGDDKIIGWDWSQIYSERTHFSTGTNTTVTPFFELVPPQLPGPRGSTREVAETNALVYDEESRILYSASGDGLVYGWDLNSSKVVRTFGSSVNQTESNNVDQAVYALTKVKKDLIAACGEDGLVRLWDCRAKTCVSVLDPTIGRSVSSTLPTTPSTHPWLSCIASDASGSWLCTGGGGRYGSLWNINTMTVTTTLPTASAPQTVTFDADKIISAGNEPWIYHWSFDGKLLGRVAASSQSIFALALQKEAGKKKGQVLVAAGNSPSLDVYLNHHIKSSTLTFQ